MRRKLNLFYRKSEIGFYSIENVFKTLEPFLNRSFDVTNKELPQQGTNLGAIKANLKFTSSNTADINHITGHVNYIALVTGKNSILTIHDMISALQGNPIKRLVILCFWFWLPALFVKRITVISEHTRREVFKYIPFAKSKVVCIHNPINTDYKHHPKLFNTKEPHILCVGTKANKNLDRIFKALAPIKCKLTIIGKLKNKHKQQLKDLKISYRSLADLTDEDILNAYIDCDMLCFASLYEGFGMPIIEAQAVGRPVLTSNIGAMKEIAQDTACLVDPLDVESIRDGIDKIIYDVSYRKALVEKGLENSKRFEVASIAKEYIKVYEEVLSP